MELTLDQFISQLVFLIFSFSLLLAFRSLYFSLMTKQYHFLFKGFNPVPNTVLAVHYYSKLLGLMIITSALSWPNQFSLPLAIFHFLLWGGVHIIFFIGAIYFIESIILTRFDFITEIQKKENYSYALVSGVLTICYCVISRHLIIASNQSLLVAFISHSFALIIFSLLIKQYYFFSYFSLNQQINAQRTIFVISFASYSLVCALIVMQSIPLFEQEILLVIGKSMLKLLETAFLAPLAYHGLYYFFLSRHQDTTLLYTDRQHEQAPTLAIAVNEALLFSVTGLICYTVVFGFTK